MREDTENDTRAIPTAVKRRQRSLRNTKRKIENTKRKIGNTKRRIGNTRDERIDCRNIQNLTADENPRNIKVVDLDRPANDEREYDRMEKKDRT